MQKYIHCWGVELFNSSLSWYFSNFTIERRKCTRNLKYKKRFLYHCFLVYLHGVSKVLTNEESTEYQLDKNKQFISPRPRDGVYIV